MVYKSGHIFLPLCHNSRVWRTDRQTDRQTEFSSLHRVCIPCSAVKMSFDNTPLKCMWMWSR